MCHICMQLSCQYCSANRLFYFQFWEKYITSISGQVIWGSLVFILLGYNCPDQLFIDIWSGHVNQQIDMGMVEVGALNRHLRYNR